MGIKTRSYMTEPSWVGKSNGILRGDTWRKKSRCGACCACVLFESQFHEYGDAKLQIGSLMHHNEWYISIYIHIHPFSYVCIRHELFRIATSQECLDVWNSSKLDPGGGGCQWPPFIHGFMISNPWGQTSSGSPKLKQRIWLFRLPSKIFFCSSWPIMLLPVVYFRVFFVFGESHTRRIWESRHLVLKNSHASMQ